MVESRRVRWKTRLNVFVWMKHLFDRKREECDIYFVNLLFGSPTHTPSPTPPRTPTPTSPPNPPRTSASAYGYAPAADCGHKAWTRGGQHDNEASCSNPSSLYFDPEFCADYVEQHAIPSLPQLRRSGMTVPAQTFESNLETFHPRQGEELFPNQGMSSSDAMSVDSSVVPNPIPRTYEAWLHPYAVPNQYQQTSPTDCDISVNDYVNECTDSEFTDATEIFSQSNCSYQVGHPSVSMTSVDQVENIESLRDTGNSSTQSIQTQMMSQYVNFLERELGLAGTAKGRWRAIAYLVKNYSTLLRSRRQNGASSSSIMGEEDSPKYKGIRLRNNKWVAEIRVAKTKIKVWLGSYTRKKDAALAYDAGLHHCNQKKLKKFNFRESIQKLGASQYINIIKLREEEMKTAVKKLAEDHVKAYGSTNIR